MTTAASEPILARLSRLHPKRIDLSLARLHRLLDRLQNPEERLPPVIHIAGTNGKGSVAAFARAVLEVAGQRVHVYTSPHLIHFHERIVVAGRPISEQALCAALDACEQANDGAPITFFEITTAAAFLAFAATPADVAILETGLGGRLDATNVVTRPAVTVITPVSLDHQEFLGATLGRIAFEKAGILKPGVAAVVARQAPEALAVILERAGAIGAPVEYQDHDWRVVAGEDGFRFEAAGMALELPAPSLAGAHQIDNAGTAVAALRAMPGERLAQAVLAAGLAGAVWPARLQRLAGRLAARLPAGWELWLDGGHNPGAARILTRHAVTAWDDRPVDLVTGMLRSKDLGDFLSPFAGHVRRLAGVPIAGEANAFTAEEVAARARGLGVNAISADGATAALAALTESGGEGGRILICGSLYLAGSVLAEDAGSG